MKIYYKEYCTEFFDDIKEFDYFFHLEKDKWILTESLEQSKIILTKPNCLYNESNLTNLLSEDQVVLVWVLEATPEFRLIEFLFESNFYRNHKKIIVVHTNKVAVTTPQFISHDIMFNRQKLYFTEYNPDMCEHKFWTYGVPRSAYTLAPIEKHYSNNNKMFLMPNRFKAISDIMSFNYVKSMLQSFIEKLNPSIYNSNPINGTFFEPNGWNDSTIAKTIDTSLGGLFSPIGDQYYNTSYITLCVESVYYTPEMFYPCEKYFDPLIKGNFPLIFASSKVVHNLKTIYGFKFPNWIDYSYDDIDNFTDRFESYKNSIEKISKLSLLDLHDLYLSDKHILEHNRNVFFNHPYDSLYDKVKNSISQLGW